VINRVRWKFYVLALAAACGTFLLSSGFIHNFFSSDTYWDDALLAVAVLCTTIGFLYQRELRKAEIERQRFLAFRATMVTIEDLLGNFLNNLQFIKSEAFCMPEDIRKLFNQITTDVTVHLKAISELETLEEKPMAIGTGIHYPLPQSQHSSHTSGQSPLIQ